MSTLYRSATATSPAVERGEWWEVLPGERVWWQATGSRPTANPEIVDCNGVKIEGGLVQPNDGGPPYAVSPNFFHVYFEVMPDISPPPGKTRLWRLKPGQLFYFDERRTDQGRDWELQEAGEKSALHVSHRTWAPPHHTPFPDHIADVDRIVIVVPQLTPPDEAGVCEDCANTGWYFAYSNGRPVPRRCTGCTILLNDTVAWDHATRLGFTTPPNPATTNPHRRPHLTYTAHISFKADNTLGVPAVSVEQAIWDALADKYPQDLQVCVTSSPLATPIPPPPPPAERSRVITLD